MRRAFAAIGFGALWACSAQPPAAPKPAPTPAATASTPTSAAALPAPSAQPKPQRRLRDVLCGPDASCELRETVASIQVDGGGTHALVRTTFPEPASGGPQADPPCVIERFWLVALEADGSVTRHKAFAEGCTEDRPEGSWCGIPPGVEIKHDSELVMANWWSPALRCMGAYRSSGTETASLRSLHSLRSEQTFYRALHFEESQTTTWDWQALRGTLSWHVQSGDCPQLRRGPVPLIPSIVTDPAFRAEGWKTLGLHGCSTSIDQSNGVALSGAKAKVGLRALVTSDTLFVEVEPAAGSAPVKSAELRVCVASGVPIMGQYCTNKLIPDCARIALDGSVRQGDLGLADGFRVERAGDRLRYRIPLPIEHLALTVAYVEPHSGRSLSTSPLTPLDATSLSEAFEIDPRLGQCEVQGDELVLARRPEAL